MERTALGRPLHFCRIVAESGAGVVRVFQSAQRLQTRLGNQACDHAPAMDAR